MISTELPIQTNSELQTRSEDATPRGLGVMCDFYVARAENAELWDVEGRRFIDFSSGISVNNVGHRHPKVVRAVRKQLDQFMHTAYSVVPYPGYVKLAERINQLTPGSHRKKPAAGVARDVPQTKATLALKDGVLTGSVAGRNGDTPISDATFKDDAIAFTVTRTFGDNTIKMTYTGKLDGDTITGTFDRPNPDGGDPVKVDWKATRVKDAAPAN